MSASVPHRRPLGAVIARCSLVGLTGWIQRLDSPGQTHWLDSLVEHAVKHCGTHWPQTGKARRRLSEVQTSLVERFPWGLAVKTASNTLLALASLDLDAANNKSITHVAKRDRSQRELCQRRPTSRRMARGTLHWATRCRCTRSPHFHTRAHTHTRAALVTGRVHSMTPSTRP